MYIDRNGQMVLWLAMMGGQQSFTLHWRSFLRWGRERFTSSGFYEGGHYFIYDCLQPVTPQITQDTRPTIVDAPLTLICKMGRGGYRNMISI